jgi:hypothetical protein
VLKEPSDKIIYYDFEAQQETGNHIVNLSVAQYHNIPEGEEEYHIHQNITEVCIWMLKQQGYTMIAHNARGYDVQFILKYLVDNGHEPFTIYQGGKIMMMSWGKGKNAIRWIDSLSFLLMPLKKFPKTFGVKELTKGYFPHFFNTKENENYVGAMPDKKHYGYNQMSTDDREKFIEWYDEQVSNNVVFDMKKDILAYCKSDVDILKRGCTIFRQSFLDQGIDPFQYCTIASTCMALYRAKFMPLNSIAVVPEIKLPEQHSTTSIEWLEWIDHKQDIDIQHALNGGEKVLTCGGGVAKQQKYKVDGYDAENKTVYEFHGCYWHGCPKCFKSTARNMQKGCTMGVLQSETVKKTNALKTAGYTVHEMYECEWQQTKKSSKPINEFLKTIDTHEELKPLDPRDAFFGGRTNASKLYWKPKDPEKECASYADITSLYPTVQYYDEYPLGHHESIKFRGDATGLDKLMRKTYYGIVKCSIIPPKGLYHPVLPVKCNGKLMFPLCHTCAKNEQQTKCICSNDERSIIGTWHTAELYKAIQMGYIVTKVYEVWHWKETTTDLFKEYVAHFLKLKQEASGWPEKCISEEQKQKYIDDYQEHQGITLDCANIVKNDGKRAVAKLCLNSLWGKFGQNSNKPQTEYISSDKQLYKLLSDPKIDEIDINIINNEVIQANYSIKQRTLQNPFNTNIMIALSTTAQARMRLYSKMDELGERVLYNDTDSIVYRHSLLSNASGTDGKVKLGNYLGDWTDELGGGGKHIQTWVSGGPRCYGYKLNDGSSNMKLKGFSLNYQNKQALNIPNMFTVISNGLGITDSELSKNAFEDLSTLLTTTDEQRFAKMAKRKGTVSVHNKNQITRSKKDLTMTSKYLEKQFSYTYTKRVVEPIPHICKTDAVQIDTRPYGY